MELADDRERYVWTSKKSRGDPRLPLVNVRLSFSLWRGEDVKRK